MEKQSTTERSIEELREEIDQLDSIILASIQRRSQISKLVGETRISEGGTRLVHAREMQIIERYSELGPEGKDIALPILKLGRGALGREMGR